MLFSHRVFGFLFGLISTWMSLGHRVKLVYAAKRPSSSVIKLQGKKTKTTNKQWTCNTAGFDSDFQRAVLVSQKGNIDSEYLLQRQKLNHMVGEGKGRGGSILQMEDCVHYSGFNIACIHGAMPFSLGKHHKHSSCLAGWMKDILQNLHVRPLAWHPRHCKSSTDKPHLLKETDILTSLTQAKPSNLGK